MKYRDVAAEANAAIDAAYVHHVRELERRMHEARYRLDAAARDYANACDRYRDAAAPSSLQPATKT